VEVVGDGHGAGGSRWVGRHRIFAEVKNGAFFANFLGVFPKTVLEFVQILIFGLQLPNLIFDCVKFFAESPAFDCKNNFLQFRLRIKI
jgi:hypothetical protein